jgi:carboxypeptidase Q
LIYIRFFCALLLSTGSLFTTAWAQSPPASSLFGPVSLAETGTGAWTAEQIATMARLRDAALTDDYAIDQLRHLSNNIGPRLSGSPQAAQAVQYVADQMRALGATVTLEKTMVPHWVRGVETGALVQWKDMTPHTEQRIVLTAFGGTVPTPPSGIVAPVIVVSSFDELQRLPLDSFKGKIVLLNRSFDKAMAAQNLAVDAVLPIALFRKAVPALATAGAVAVLIRSISGADYRLPHTGFTFSDPASPKVPTASVSAEDADLMADLARQGEVRMRLVLTPQLNPKVESYNVIADWKGSTHPEQVVIVSGHLDSWDLGTGALDDGTGIVMSMQTIHLLKKLDIHPQRTIRFIAWMDEESGSEGAATYAQEHANEIVNHVGALESDLGADHPTGITFVGKPELGEWLRPVAHQLESIGAPNLTSGDDAGTDVSSIVSKGVPGFTPTQDSRFYFNYHHSAADTFDKVSPRFLNENAAIMTVTAYALADASAPPPR